MTYNWFNLVLEALGKKLNFESISNLYGNSFAKDSANVIQAANPLIKKPTHGGNGISGLVGNIKVIETKNKDAAIKSAQKTLGDFSWAKEFINGDMMKGAHNE